VKRNTWRMVVLAVVAAVGMAMAVDWTDNFESYPTGQWPSPDWIPSGNSDGSIVTDVKYAGAKSFRMYGDLGAYWGTCAHRYIGTDAAYTIDFWIRNGDEPIPPTGHQYRGSIDLHTQAHWVPPAARIMDWDANGQVHGRGGTRLGSYEPLTWYHVQVHYERSASTVHMEYWIGGVKKGEEDLDAHESEMDFDYIALTAQAGTVWYDDVSLTGGTDPGPDPDPDPITFGDGMYVASGYAYWDGKGRTDIMLDEFKARGIKELYVNVGGLDVEGRPTHERWLEPGGAGRDTLALFVKKARLAGFRVHAMIGGNTDSSNHEPGKPPAPVVRLRDPSVRQAIAIFCWALCTQVGFDGVNWDIEPIASSFYMKGEPVDARFDYFTETLDLIRGLIGDSRPLSAHVETWTWSSYLDNVWFWSLTDYRLAANHCDHMIGMAYACDGNYEAWIKEQIGRMQQSAPGKVSLALPAYNASRPKKCQLSDGLKGYRRAVQRPAGVAVYAPAGYHEFNVFSDMDTRDPYCAEDEWLAYDSLWHSDGRTGIVSMSQILPRDVTVHRDTLSVTVTWVLPATATHANVHWSLSPSGRDLPSYEGLSGTGAVHMLNGVYHETIHMPADSAIQEYNVKNAHLRVHAKIGDVNWYSTIRSVRVDPSGSGGQGTAVVLNPTANACEAAFPDPFSGTTKISYTVGEHAGSGSRSTLSIVDRAGRVVRHLVNRKQPTGAYSAMWDGRDDAGRKLPAGVYLYRLTIGNFSTARKIVKSE
jgi:hypothetical protein